MATRKAREPQRAGLALAKELCRQMGLSEEQISSSRQLMTKLRDELILLRQHEVDNHFAGSQKLSKEWYVALRDELCSARVKSHAIYASLLRFQRSL